MHCTSLHRYSNFKADYLSTRKSNRTLSFAFQALSMHTCRAVYQRNNKVLMFFENAHRQSRYFSIEMKENPGSCIVTERFLSASLSSRSSLHFTLLFSFVKPHLHPCIDVKLHRSCLFSFSWFINGSNAKQLIIAICTKLEIRPCLFSDSIR